MQEWIPANTLRARFRIRDVLPLAKIGNASKTSLSKPLNLVRGVFDLEVRRKPQAFAADAVSLWILNQSPLIINGLALYAKPHFSGPYSLSMAQSSVHGACGFVLTAKPEATRRLPDSQGSHRVDPLYIRSPALASEKRIEMRKDRQR
jgi:hypothetical protein